MTSKEIKKTGFYWTRRPKTGTLKYAPTIVFIRRFNHQWCILKGFSMSYFYWEISEEDEYYGPIAKPPGW